MTIVLGLHFKTCILDVSHFDEIYKCKTVTAIPPNQISNNDALFV